MSAIQQIYCTHCTHGSSALEQREGELARRMLGYSARAGSLARQHLRRYYCRIERYVYYYLPRDTPAEDKLRLTAATAPRRLIYLSSTGGLQLTAQVCYRPLDTEGRPGSYFAHVLFREDKPGRPRWSQLECLKLWAAPGWVEEDSPDIPFLLPALASLDEMHRAERPALNDGVLLSFLKTPADGAFDDPGGVIPRRWRRKEPQERADLFAAAFGGLLEISASRRESLLLVVEPGLAALLFYGMVRLLPPGGIRDPISFSTFEPNPERLGTTLAAVEFHDSRKTDLRSEAYRGRGFAVNTFSGRRSEARRPQAEYAQTMLRRLLEEGFAAVDWRLGNLHAAGPRRVEDLDQLAAADRLAHTLLDPWQPYRGHRWPTTPAAKDYLRQVFARRLSECADPQSLVTPLVGQPAHLSVLELLAAEPGPPGVRAAADYLLRKLPPEAIAELLKLARVPREAKVEVLARHVAAEADLPPGCDCLWDEKPAPSIKESAAAAPLLTQVLARLDPAALERFYRKISKRHGEAFVVALVAACRGRPGGWAPLTKIVGVMDEAGVLSLYRSLGPRFFKEYPQDEPAMPARLHQILQSLPKPPERFQPRLDVLVAGERLLPDDDDRRIVAAWANCRRAIVEIGALQKQKSRLLRQRPVDRIEAAARRMATAIARALPPETFRDDRSGTGKQKCLRQIGRRLLDGRPLLPAGTWQNRALWQKVTWYFERGLWPRAPLRKLRPKSRAVHAVWWTAGGVAAAALVIAVILVTNTRSRRGRPAAPPPQTANIPAEAAERRLPERNGPENAEEAKRQRAEQIARAERSRKQRVAAEKEAKEREEAERRRTAAEAAARQEAQRREAEEKAARPAAMEPARRAEEEPRLAERSDGDGKPTGRATKETWIPWAKRFAADHAGTWFCEEPFPDGQLAIPSDALPLHSDPPALYLGEGKLDLNETSDSRSGLEQSIYKFGGGFENRAPSSRQEIPRLAEQLGLKSVFVEARVQPSGAVLVLGAVPKGLPDDIEITEPEYRRPEEPARRRTGSALAALKARCRRITTVVFQDATGLAGAEQPAAGEVVERPQDPAGRREQPDVAVDEAPSPGETVIKVDQKRAVGLSPPAVAQIRVIVTGAQGKPLPRSFKEDFVFGCVIMEEDSDGFVRSKVLPDIAAVGTSDVLDGASSVRYRFQFFRRSGDPFDTKHTLLAETPWREQRIEPGTQYTIKLELGEGQVGRLRDHLRRLGAR